MLKFKRRKATAQKKLEDEQQNLVRVNDILAELTRQVGPLETTGGTRESLSEEKGRTEGVRSESVFT